MKQFAAIVALGAFASARRLRSEQGQAKSEQAYGQFVSKYNKDVKSTGQYKDKLAIFERNEGVIKAKNEKADKSSDRKAVRLAMNWTGDLTAEEYEALQGLDVSKTTDRPKRLTKHNKRKLDDQGRQLIDVATEVDHVASGAMGPVKNQQSCGSCWAFAATSALEGTIAKRSGNAPVRLSEQQSVDCTTNNEFNQNLFGKTYGSSGCNGGWMSNTWRLSQEQGAMLNSDYPYRNTEQQCAHDFSDASAKTYTQSWGQIDDDTDDIKAKLMDQPLAIAINASLYEFQFYKSGVLRESDGCSTSVNHAVVIVGYSEGSPSTTTEMVHNWWYTMESTGEETDAPAVNEPGTWKIQNSWATSWGDDGFILFEVSAGAGVCGMNQYVYYVD